MPLSPSHYKKVGSVTKAREDMKLFEIILEKQRYFLFDKYSIDVVNTLKTKSLILVAYQTVPCKI